MDNKEVGGILHATFQKFGNVLIYKAVGNEMNFALCKQVIANVKKNYESKTDSKLDSFLLFEESTNQITVLFKIVREE